MQEETQIAAYIKEIKERNPLTKPFRHKTLEERAVAYVGKFNLDGEFNFGKPVGREGW